MLWLYVNLECHCEAKGRPACRQAGAIPLNQRDRHVAALLAMTQNMRIAFIGQKGIPAIYGGVERHVEELAAELVKQGHEVLAYARDWYAPKNLSEHRGVKIIFTPTVHTKHLDAVVHTFTSTLHAIFQKPDVIHYHGVGPSLLSWIPRLFAPKIKVIATFHCIDRYHQKWGWFARLSLALGERAACLFPHRTIAVSRSIQSYCWNEYKKEAIYNPNGVRPAEKTNATRLSEFELEPNKYILMVSRLVKHKGAHYLLSAWKNIRQQYPELFAGHKLAIVGGSAFTDDYVKELKNAASGDQSVIFTDWQHGEPLEQLYANAKLLVHPSENEGLPLTVLQAMAHGRPVLVSDIPEHQELISDGRFWFLNGSVSSLAERLVELFKNENWMKEAGEKNRRLAEKNFDWKTIAEKTAAVYAVEQEKVISLKFKKA